GISLIGPNSPNSDLFQNDTGAMVQKLAGASIPGFAYLDVAFMSSGSIDMEGGTLEVGVRAPVSSSFSGPITGAAGTLLEFDAGPPAGVAIRGPVNTAGSIEFFGGIDSVTGTFQTGGATYVSGISYVPPAVVTFSNTFSATDLSMGTVDGSGTAVLNTIAPV